MKFSDWKNVQLQDVVSKLGDGLHGTPKYDENGEYFFINGNNLVDGKVVIKENTKRVSVEEYKKYKKELNDRTILLGINGTIGNVALYENEKCVLGKSACYFNVVNSVDKQFVKYVITKCVCQKVVNYRRGGNCRFLKMFLMPTEV
jgi:type I restriction enzyme S subunit